MEIYAWNTLLVLSKLGFYTGLIVIVGHIIHQNNILNYVKLKSSEAYSDYLNAIITILLLAIILTLSGFYASIGVITGEGPSVVANTQMVEIVWSTSIGTSTLFRFIGLVIAISYFLLIWEFQRLDENRTLKWLLLGSAGLVLLYSIRLTGHVSVLGILEQINLAIHVAIMAWWFSALWPLKLACNKCNSGVLIPMMEKFGKQASFLVSVLLIIGLILSITLLESIIEFIKTPYGQLLLLKISVVLAILSVAAINKLSLVPRLNTNSGIKRLSASISIEIVLAIIILVITASLTTLTGPNN